MTPRRLILGTAGHIDHGKTTLLRALTGMDCDRLPEEKQRGITIDIGFANLDLGEYQLGIVDVPGHERFIKNMLAGAVGIDIALLVIAADDSVMPQTREHLAILQLLGIQQGVVAITKCDRAEAAWLDLVEDDIRLLLADTFLKDAPIVRTSVSPEGAATGIEELRAAIAGVCGRVVNEEDEGFFRLPIDRSFSVQGLGTVVTGTVWSGRLRAGEEIEWLPSGEKLTVRGIQNHGQPVEEIQQGQRAAINLSGVHHSDVHRGQELATAGHLRATKVLTVDLHVLADSPWPIKHRSRQRLYIGTQEVMVTVSLLRQPLIEPGQSGLAQLHCAEPTVALARQPFVIRAESPLVTIGGGNVLLPSAGRIARRQTHRIEWLEQLVAAPPEERVAIAAYFGGMRPARELALSRDAGLSEQRTREIMAELAEAGTLIDIAGEGRPAFPVHQEVLEAAGQRIEQQLARLHRQTPLRLMVPRERVVQACEAWYDAQTMSLLLDWFLADGTLRGEGKGVALAAYEPQLSPTQQRLYEQVLAAWQAGGLKPPQPADLYNDLATNETDLREILEYCTDRGELVFVAPSIYLHREAESEMRAVLTRELKDSPGLTIGEIRELLDTSRKFAVPIVEYLDKIGFTKRQGDLRQLR